MTDLIEGPVPLSPPEKMTAEEFRSALDDLGWRQVDLATRTGMSQDAVSNWSKGHRSAPGVVVAYLRLAKLARAAGVLFETSPGPWGSEAARAKKKTPRAA